MPDIPVVVLGGGGVGKSCLTIQYMQGHFVDKYDATIEDVYRKPVDVDNQPAVLVIIDTAGQDAFGAMRDQYLKKGQGFVLVYSITDPESFRQIKRIYAQLLRVKGDQVVPCVVVGNKIDQASYRAVSTEDGSLFAGQVSCPFLEVTAKNRRMAEDVFETLVRTIRNDGKSSADQMQVHVANTVTPSVPMAHVEAEQSNCAVGSSLSSSSPSKQQQDRATAPPTAPEKRSKKKKSRCALL